MTGADRVTAYGELYAAAHERITALVRAAGADIAATTVVPACPAWTVKDVVAHLAGVCADVLAGNIEGAATDGWTAAQVEARREHSVDAVINEWCSAAPGFAGMLDDFPGWYGAQLVADVTTHEQDLRSALGQAPTMNDGMMCGLDFIVSAVAHPAAAARGLGPLEIRASDAKWVVGSDDPATGEPLAAVAATIQSGQRLPDPTRPPIASLSADPRELCRAFLGRRSAAQIRGLDWSCDPEPYLPLFAQAPFFALRDADLVD